MTANIWALDKPMYGSNKAAWHGLGTVVTGQPTAEACIHLAGLDWRVDTEHVMTRHGLKVPNTYITVRTDLEQTNADRILGVVGNRYTPIQNQDAFDICNAFKATGEAHFESAGSLCNGRVVWLLMKLDESDYIGTDKLDEFLLINTTHDGSGSLEILLTTIRVVCDNTLQVALATSDNKVRIRHTKSAQVSIDKARKTLGLAKQHREQQVKAFTRLQDTPITDRFAEAFVNTMYPDKEDTNNTRARKARETLLDLYGGTAVGSSADTSENAWGLFNAFTEYLDHKTAPESTTKTERQVAESRMQSRLSGRLATQRQTGFDLLSHAVDHIDQYGQVTQTLENTQRKDVDTLLDSIALD